MNLDSQLKLQAYLDGELPPRQARRMATWLAEDQEARLLLAELQNTKAALAGHESETKLTECREFYWHKIESEIQRQAQTRTEAGALSFIIAWWRKYPIPVSAAAALLALALMVTKQYTSSSGSTMKTGQNQARHFPEFESASVDTHGFTFRDHSAGMTLVWISYRNDEGFTDTDLLDTIQ